LVYGNQKIQDALFHGQVRTGRSDSMSA
jgi:hypothetical protein